MRNCLSDHEQKARKIKSKLETLPTEMEWMIINLMRTSTSIKHVQTHK